MKIDINKKTTDIINELWNHGDPNKAALAGLRSSQSINSRQAVVVWPLMLAEMDRQDLSSDGKPRPEEIAIFTALRCFALYQQGKGNCLLASSSYDSQFMNVLAKLRQDEQVRPALDRRVQSLLITNNIDSVVNSLIHLVSIVKARGSEAPVNFAGLAQDLYDFQFNFGTMSGARRVALRWGRQYYWNDAKHNESKEK